MSETIIQPETNRGTLSTRGRAAICGILISLFLLVGRTTEIANGSSFCEQPLKKIAVCLELVVLSVMCGKTSVSFASNCATAFRYKSQTVCCCRNRSPFEMSCSLLPKAKQ